MRHISLRSKIYLGFLVAALLIGATRYFYFLSTNQYIDTALQIQRTQQVMGQLETVISLAKDAETGERGYIITRQERFLEPFARALRNLDREMKDLETMTARNPYYPPRIRQLETLVQRQIGILNANVVRVRSGRNGEAARDVAAGTGKRALDDMRRLVGTMQAHERSRLDFLLGRLESKARLNNRVNLLSITVLALLSGLGMYTILRDVRRRERLDRELTLKNGQLEALNAGQQHLLGLLEEAQAIGRLGSFTLDATTRLFTPSLQHCLNYGLDPAIAGIPSPISLFFERLHPDDRQRVQQAIETSLTQGGAYRQEYRVVLPDGQERYILVRGRPVRLGDRLYLRGTTLDTTEQKEAETELRASETRFRALLESAPDAMIITDEGSHIQLVNAQTEHLFGYTRAELVGQPVELLIPASLTARHRQHRAAYAYAPKLRSMGVGLDLKGVRKDGTEFPVEISLSPIQTGEGLLVAAAIRDVSERKRYEAQLERLNQALQATNEELAANVEELAAAGEKIQEYSDEVEQKNLQLQRTNADLEAFSYSISHDLKSPLRSVLSFAGILQDEYAASLDPEAKRLIGIVVRNARFMNELIEALLQFARLGRTAVRKEAVDMDKMVQGLVAELLADRPAKPVVTLNPLGVARADHQLIRQVWQNLLSNALKFSATRPEPRIEVGHQWIADEAVYYVRDNGVGFNPAYAGELFGVFKRLHPAGAFPGTGVGLAICQRIVTGHGGRIWAEAAEGEGATFYFTLKGDVAAGDRSPEPKEASSTPYALPNPRS
ncbi:MAG: PAS domain S-box protein [Cytophagales bacterium]|nr:PAS domain S-box protein [Cytophagales bacterium]